MLKLFGTSGIRGYTNSEISPLFALDIAQSFGYYLRKGNIAVGIDTRYGAEMLKFAVVSGLVSNGINVFDCGCLPTSALSNYIFEKKLSGGIMLTGSHMPYDRIGIIFLESNGTYASFALSKKIEKIYFEKKYKVKIPIEKIGKIYVSNDAVEIYKKKILKIVKIKKMNFKILADPCNGTASKILPCILKKFGCDVIEVNCLEKNKPDREPEPRAHSLRKTAKLVKKFGCDLGVATDIDADRVVFIDANGNVIMEDLIGVIFASRIFKKKKGTLVLPVNSSLLIESLAKKYGWKIVYCKIGQPNTMASFKKYNADYAYEESGKYYFVENGQIWCDGILTTLKILELLSNEDTTLESIVKEFPKIYQKKVKIKCREEEKEKIMKNLHKHLTDFNLKKEIRIDGLKRIYKDNSWVIIRPSGTELYIRIFAESREKRRAEELVEAGRKAVYSARCH